MRLLARALYAAAFVLLTGCAASSPGVEQAARVGTVQATSDSVVTVAILQLNDVYEITPVEAGRFGGLARVATLRQRLLGETPHVVTVMAGDFFSPSALGTARVEGERLNGRQMVAVLNTLGLDLAAFGNHEFDLDERSFLARLGESRFRYVAANVTDAEGGQFPRSSPHRVLTFQDGRGSAVRVAFVGVTIDSNPKPYVRYSDPIEALSQAAVALRDSAEALVALTHLALTQDIEAAMQVPALDLILGGHEHENILLYRGPDLTPLTKADANARTVYVHRLSLHPRRGLIEISSEMVPITDSMPEEPETAAEVQRWLELGFAGFREAGFDPVAVVSNVPLPLDGREASVRNDTTALTHLIAEALHREAGDGTDLAVYNSGSIRIDDVLPPGPVTEYDVIRVLPFGGTVLSVEVRGSTLDSVLTQGALNRGSGGFLQTAGVARDEAGRWSVGGRPLDPARTYRVATTDFLVSGRETGLGFFRVDGHPHVRLVSTHGDIRRAVIDEIQRRYGSPSR